MSRLALPALRPSILAAIMSCAIIAVACCVTGCIKPTSQTTFALYNVEQVLGPANMGNTAAQSPVFTGYDIGRTVGGGRTELHAGAESPTASDVSRIGSMPGVPMVQSGTFYRTSDTDAAAAITALNKLTKSTAVDQHTAGPNSKSGDGGTSGEVKDDDTIAPNLSIPVAP